MIRDISMLFLRRFREEFDFFDTFFIQDSQLNLTRIEISRTWFLLWIFRRLFLKKVSSILLEIRFEIFTLYSIEHFLTIDKFAIISKYIIVFRHISIMFHIDKHFDLNELIRKSLFFWRFFIHDELFIDLFSKRFS